MFKEFKEFALKGSVMDMAVGIIAGAAFTKVVNSLVTDILMPPLGLIAGNMDFSDLYLNLSGTGYATLDAARAAGAPVLRYGEFMNTVISFLIVTFATFILVRQVNRFKRSYEVPSEAGLPAKKECPFCRSSIPVAATRCAYCTSELADTRGHGRVD